MSTQVTQWEETKPKDEKYTEFFRKLGCDCEVETLSYGYAKTMTLTHGKDRVRLVANSSMLEIYVPVTPKQEVWRLSGKLLGDDFIRDFPHTDEGYKQANDLLSRLDGGAEVTEAESEIDQ